MLHCGQHGGLQRVGLLASEYSFGCVDDKRQNALGVAPAINERLIDKVHVPLFGPAGCVVEKLNGHVVADKRLTCGVHLVKQRDKPLFHHFRKHFRRGLPQYSTVG